MADYSWNGSPIHVVRLETCASTQAVAQQQLAAGTGAVLVVAEHQTDGRGRQGRTWSSHPGKSLVLSIGWSEGIAVEHLDGLSLRVARAVAATLSAASGASIEACAPNDLVSGSPPRKVGGILIDSRTVGSAVTALVLGLGINVLGEPFCIAGRDATTLAAISGAAPDMRTTEGQVVQTILHVVGAA